MFRTATDTMNTTAIKQGTKAPSGRRSERRVVITGMGVIAPTGLTVAELFASQVAGRSGVGLITLFDARAFPTRIAAEVQGFDPERYFPNPARFQHCGRGTLFALAAAHQPVAEAGPVRGGDPPRRGVYLAVEGGGQDFSALG